MCQRERGCEADSDQTVRRARLVQQGRDGAGEGVAVGGGPHGNREAPQVLPDLEILPSPKAQPPRATPGPGAPPRKD
eukprot:4769110-Pyramimonas_sp.AAC.1